MRVSAQVRHHLIKAGAEVHMTRWDDRKVVGGNSGRDAELGERVALAERTKSHMFLSLHHNAAPRKTADGVVVLIWPTAEDGTTQTLEIAFADALREEVEKKVHFTEEFGHYIHKHPLVVNSEMPSAVIEFGFLSNAEFDEWVSQKGIHRPEAIGIYNGVKKFWEENKEALEAKRQELFPGAPKARGGNKNISDARPPLEKLVETLWLSEDPPADAFAAKKLLNLYKNTVLSDKTFFYLNTEVQSGSGEWTVTGSTNHPILLEAATEVLFYAGCPPTRNYIDELPSDKLGEKKFGVVQIPMALTWAKPEENSACKRS
jgi:N-acetylmuramoyl-L-alanine amidase